MPSNDTESSPYPDAETKNDSRESASASSTSSTNNGPPYSCDQCGQTFGEDEENPLQNYAAHFNTTRHKEAADSTSLLGKPRVVYQLLVSQARRLGLPDSPRESGTSRDGAFSYAFEWHAFLFGFGGGLWLGHDQQAALPVIVGVIAAAFGADVAGRVTKRVPTYIREQIQQELHYFVGGVLCGFGIILYLHGDLGHPLRMLPFFDHGMVPHGHGGNTTANATTTTTTTTHSN